MNKKELLKKIKALADSGVGGEKENAQKILAGLMKQYDISEEELSEENIKEFEIKMPKVYKAAELANQVLYSIVGKENGDTKGLFSWRGTKHYFIRCTAAEFLEFEAKLKFYAHFFKKELDTFYSAFVQANSIFPPPNKSKPSGKHTLTEEDMKMLALASRLDKHEYLLQIEGGK